MIVYHETAQNFINTCNIVNSNGECDKIANEISQQMLKAGIGGADVSQMNAWRRSLTFVAKALAKSNIDKDVKVAI